MTGNQRGQFVQTLQGPRGIPGPNGVPMARRRRRALINIEAIDAAARAKNAAMEEARMRLLQEDPEQARILAEEAARLQAAEEAANQAAAVPNSSDSLANARRTIEGIDAAERNGSRGATEEVGDLDPRDLDGFAPPRSATAPVEGLTAESATPPTPADTQASEANQDGRPPRKQRQKPKTKTTTIQA